MRDKRSDAAPRSQGAAKHITQGERQRRGAAVDSAPLEEQCHPRKIFVGGLAHKTGTQCLRDYFQRFGSIVDAVVLRWPDGSSRGFGYVTFNDAAAASLALKETHSVGGRQVDVKRAVPGTNKLFVGGLPQCTKAAELREHFETFGVVSDAVVMTDPTTSRSRGFGFVCFLPGQEGATAVNDALARRYHKIRGKWIEVKSAAPPHKLVAAKGDGQEEDDLSTVDSLAAAEAEEARLTSGGQPEVPAGPPPGLGEPQKVVLPGSMKLGAPPGLHQLPGPPPGLTATTIPTPARRGPRPAEAAAAAGWPSMPGCVMPSTFHAPRPDVATLPAGPPGNFNQAWGIPHRRGPGSAWSVASSTDRSWTGSLVGSYSTTTASGMGKENDATAAQVSDEDSVVLAAPTTTGRINLFSGNGAKEDLQKNLEQLLRLESVRRLEAAKTHGKAVTTGSGTDSARWSTTTASQVDDTHAVCEESDGVM